MMGADRRSVLAGGAALAAGLAAPGVRAATKAATPVPGAARFPAGFLWGASTAGHQIEGNNVNSDCWLLENVKPTVFAEPSGDAADSLNRWGTDMDLAQAMGLNTYRFSIEWARIEPEPGQFSVAMLDHYARMIDGAGARGLKAIVTFNHFVSPRWFGARGGWTNPEAPKLFARFCDVAARRLAGGISHAITFNEPQILRLLKAFGLPPQVWDLQRAMLVEAARLTTSPKFTATNAANMEDIETLQQGMFEGHRLGKAAIKAARGDLPVGVSLAMLDDQAVGKNSLRDAKRKELYGGWLDLARSDDFIGVQNYERALWNDKGRLPPPPGSRIGHMGAEVYPLSLAGAVRFAHAATGVPVLVSEHGVGTEDDATRAWMIPEALRGLSAALAGGVPVIGYCHWSLIDNFEWISGYKPKFGLHSFDRTTFKRTAKPSAAVYGAIARANAV